MEDIPDLPDYKEGLHYGTITCPVCGKDEWDVWPVGKPDKCRECGHKALMDAAYNYGRAVTEKQEAVILAAIKGGA